MSIVNYPLQIEKDFHTELRKAAFKSEKTMKDYIIAAVKEKIERDNQQNQL